MRILLRSRQDPFTPTTARRTYARNQIGNNVGNLVFSHAAHRILSVESTTVTSTSRYTRLEAARINAEHDAFVIPLANAFRPSYQQRLDEMSQLIEQLTIPVVVLGVGAQAGTDLRRHRLKGIDASVTRFVRAVLDRSASIGVRGEFTQHYLRTLGFRDVDVIGCPSLFMRGADLTVQKPVARLTRRSPIAVTISPYVTAMGPIVMSTHQRYDDLLYIAQDLQTLGLMLDGNPAKDAHDRNPIPVHAAHPLYREGKMRFCLDPWTWFDLLRTRDFSFGTRIHGTIASLLAGTPAVLLAHDSRTLELAQYHEIPHRLVSDVPGDVDPADLHAEADFTGFTGGHAERLRTFTSFMERNGLPHVFTAAGEDPGAAAFDRRVAQASFRPPVRPRGTTRRGVVVSAVGRGGYHAAARAKRLARSVVGRG